MGGLVIESKKLVLYAKLFLVLEGGIPVFLIKKNIFDASSIFIETND